MSSSNFRLSQDVVPTHYDIKLKTDIKSKKFDCIVEYQFQQNQETDKIELFADKSIQIQEIVETGTENKIEYDHKENRLYIKGDIKQFVKSGVTIKFIGSLDQPNTGFYYINDTTASTQLEATHARELFPCFDEPSIKSTFKFTLTSPKDLTVFSNTPVESSSIDGDFKTSVFVKTPKMCTYLFAIVIGNFVTATKKTKSGVDIVVAAVPEKKDYLNEPLDECAKYVEWYEDFTQVPFPLPALQVVAVPDFIFGAMENFGLVIARESCSLGNSKLGSLNGFMKAMKTNAHEIAHQWAGDCVSPAWWNAVWLNEGFATIFPSIIFEQIHPDWDFWSMFFMTDLKWGLEFDQTLHTHPIHTECNSEEEIEGSFDDIVYSKAGLFIRMLMYHVGYDNFRAALRVYFKRFMYSNADTEDLKQCFAEVLNNQEINQLFDCWTKQSGYPLVILNDDGTLVQKRFTIDGLLDQKWIIPLYIAIGRKDGSVEEMKIVMNEEKMKLNIEGDFEWIKLNTGIKSLCRTIVKGKYFDMLISAIKNGKVSTYDMFSALYDMFECAKVGVVSFADLLTLLKAYKGCDKALPSQEASLVLSYLYSNFPSLKKEVTQFAVPFLESILEKIGTEARDTDNLPMSNARSEILQSLAFNYQSEKVLNIGKNLYTNYMKRGDYLFDDNFDYNLLLFTLKCGSLCVEGGYEYNKEASVKSPNPEVASSSISSLGCVSKEKLPFVLREIENLRKQNMHVVFNNCCLGPNANIEIWKYFKERLPFYLNLFKTTSFIIPSMTQAVIATAETEEQLNDMKKFFSENPIEIAASSIKSAIANMEKKFETQNLYADEIKKALI